MDVMVQMASGETDDWSDIDETIQDNGQLTLVTHIDGDEVPGNIKAITVAENIDQGPDLAPFTKHTTFRVVAEYAAGMWIKVEY